MSEFFFFGGVSVLLFLTFGALIWVIYEGWQLTEDLPIIQKVIARALPFALIAMILGVILKMLEGTYE